MACTEGQVEKMQLRDTASVRLYSEPPMEIQSESAPVCRICYCHEDEEPFLPSTLCNCGGSQWAAGFWPTALSMNPPLLSVW